MYAKFTKNGQSIGINGTVISLGNTVLLRLTFTDGNIHSLEPDHSSAFAVYHHGFLKCRLSNLYLKLLFLYRLIKLSAEIHKVYFLGENWKSTVKLKNEGNINGK